MNQKDSIGEPIEIGDFISVHSSGWCSGPYKIVGFTPKNYPRTVDSSNKPIRAHAGMIYIKTFKQSF